MLVGETSINFGVQMNKVMSVCMNNFPNFQWKIDIHDKECYETTVSGSFGPFNNIDVFSNGNNHTIVSEFGGDGKWDQQCDDLQLYQTLEDLAMTFGSEQQRWLDLINGAADYGV
jgi:hypothetical protein